MSEELEQSEQRRLRAMATADIELERAHYDRQLKQARRQIEAIPGWYVQLLEEGFGKRQGELDRRARRRTLPRCAIPVNYDLIDQAKSIDLVSLIEETVRLERRGQTWKGHCPFHEDKDPSLVVYGNARGWYCFGCHRGGSVIDWIMCSEGVGFGEALKFLLKKKFGVIEMPRQKVRILG